jgi:prepilin-type N-terminal cleavage/methylation domain-containing protein
MTRRGFTLIETIATIIILGIVATIASQTILVAMDGYIRGSTQSQLHSELSTTLERIEREIRKIPIKTGYGSIAPNITSVTASSIAWTGGFNLYLNGSQLMFADAGAAAAVLLEDVTGFTVQTYNESNAALGASLSGSACDPIRRISITVTIQRSGITETLRTKVFLRNTLDGATS